MLAIKRLLFSTLVTFVIGLLIYSVKEVELPPRYPDAKPVADFLEAPDNLGIPMFEEIGVESNTYRGEIFSTTDSLDAIKNYYQEYAAKFELTLVKTHHEQLPDRDETAFLYKSKLNKFLEIQIITKNDQSYVTLLKPRPTVSFASSWLGNVLSFVFDPEIGEFASDIVLEEHGVRNKIEDVWLDLLTNARNVGLGRNLFFKIPMTILVYLYGVTGSFGIAVISISLVSFLLIFIVTTLITYAIPFIILLPSIILHRLGLRRSKKTSYRFNQWQNKQQQLKQSLLNLWKGESCLWLLIRETILNLLTIFYATGILVSIWFFFDPTLFSRQAISAQTLDIVPTNILAKALLVPQRGIMGIDWGGNSILILPILLGLTATISQVINLTALFESDPDIGKGAWVAIVFNIEYPGNNISINPEFVEKIVLPRFGLALIIGFITPSAFLLFLVVFFSLHILVHIPHLIKTS